MWIEYLTANKSYDQKTGRHSNLKTPIPFGSTVKPVF